MTIEEALKLIRSGDMYDKKGYVNEKGYEALYTLEEVEVVPVRHGRWITENLISMIGETYTVVRCSECQWNLLLMKTQYCPNCGAKMERGKGNEID